MRSQHTPGSWTFEFIKSPDPDNIPDRFTISGNGSGKIGELSLTSLIPDLEVQEANARLIAAAPELYDALNNLAHLGSLSGVYDGLKERNWWQEMLRKAQDALERAEFGA